MRPLRHLAIFLPRTNPFYLGLLFGLRRGFEAAGVAVSGWTELPDEASCLEFVRLARPDAILEMNRTRRQRPYLPREVRHISWMVDVGEWPYDQLGGSEVLYFFGRQWADRFRPRADGLVGWLPPGTDPEAYPLAESAPLSDYGFAGHMPRPWTAAEEDRPVCRSPARTVRFGELFALCRERWREPPAGFDNELYLADALTAASGLLGMPATLDDPSLRYDISCRSVRVINRAWLIDTALAAAGTLRLAGPDNWRLWERYARHHIGRLDGAEALGRFYRSSAINLHEGVGPHFRVFDCLAAGGLLFCRRTADNALPGGLAGVLEPGRHYQEFGDADELRRLAAPLLADPARRRAIAAEASAFVTREHSWAVRARKVITDLDRALA